MMERLSTRYENGKVIKNSIAIFHDNVPPVIRLYVILLAVHLWQIVKLGKFSSSNVFLSLILVGKVEMMDFVLIKLCCCLKKLFWCYEMLVCVEQFLKPLQPLAKLIFLRKYTVFQILLLVVRYCETAINHHGLFVKSKRTFCPLWVSSEVYLRVLESI